MFKEIGLNIAIVGVAIIFGFVNYSFYAPKINEVQTKAYNDGMANDFQDL